MYNITPLQCVMGWHPPHNTRRRHSTPRNALLEPPHDTLHRHSTPRNALLEPPHDTPHRHSTPRNALLEPPQDTPQESQLPSYEMGMLRSACGGVPSQDAELKGT